MPSQIVSQKVEMEKTFSYVLGLYGREALLLIECLTSLSFSSSSLFIP